MQNVSLFFSKSLVKTIDRRIGIDDLVKRIGQVFRSEDFIKALKQPEPQASKPTDLVFDYEFTQVFKTVECKLVFYFVNLSIFRYYMWF